MHTTNMARRIVLSVLVLGIGLIHLLDLPGKWEETRWMGTGYLGLIAASLIVADLLLRRHNPLVLLLCAGVAAGPLAGFVLTRTVGLPGATDDIGNWLEPLGLASLFVEGATLLLAGLAVTDWAPQSRSGAHAHVPAPRVGAEQDAGQVAQPVGTSH
jgi:hypothetical protein